MKEAEANLPVFNPDKEGIQSAVRFRFPKDVDHILPLFDWELVSLFLSFLKEKNEAGGFFSKRDTNEILDRHILESVYHIYRIHKEIGSFNKMKVGDAGTGPGIPGFFFRCLVGSERPKLVLLDSQRRKLSHTETFVKENGIEGVEFQFARAEDWKTNWDLGVSRGFVPYPWSAEVLSRCIVNGGHYVPFIGKDEFNAKIESKILSDSGFKVEKTIFLPELEFLGMRHIKFLKKVGSARQGIPRAWKLLEKESKEFYGKDRIHQ
ncbi:16S rRNA (guanine(527)-N(7))-methyltransferase RsmG [Leptospira langatensis]|uniref:Ribosomal RNA small subunit methyltransferase G n=1 Tax=Leptospira langatensis TaxID=2484983 RepID=A0A5F1ZTZ4_9LEPT|nr:RsmG family class I SAM-dependent methyltransferase [Leptospira langatensis]TGK03158.1 16S rRNA (guanine(527)-N(7))-methyltransferase RsmG [Leptospira langatensis]TGL41914.1 16S rRNA (guanine(527)-N(7))-methyltransferase RsmG [Leptospira langatensis]